MPTTSKSRPSDVFKLAEKRSSSKLSEPKTMPKDSKKKIYQPKRIFLTGAAGFIGFHTAKALLKRGDHVTGVDNLNDYYDPNLKLERIASLSSNPNFVFFRSNIEDLVSLPIGIDAICHLAAQAGVRYSLENPMAYEMSNLRGTLNIFELARKSNVSTVVFASSSSVYGNAKVIPSREDQQLKPISYYASTKLENENTANVYHHQFGINMTGLRFFTVYGPWGRPDMAYFKFTDAIVNDKPIEVYNHGNMLRDFTYIDDIVSGIVSSIDHSYPYEIFNLARGEPVQLMDFITEIEKNLGRSAKKRMLQMQQGDVNQTFGDISKARSLLGYDPKTSIKQGIKNFIDWYKDFYKVG